MTTAIHIKLKIMTCMPALRSISAAQECVLDIVRRSEIWKLFQYVLKVCNIFTAQQSLNYLYKLLKDVK